MEDEEDDFAGPRLDMFEKEEIEDKGFERKHKDNEIYQSAKKAEDADENEADEDYQLPISHEVALAGHRKAI